MLKLSIYSTLLWCVLMLSAEVGEVSAKFNAQANNRDRGLRVMTRNMYLGTDFDDIFAAQTPEELSPKSPRLTRKSRRANLPSASPESPTKSKPHRLI
jgi:hypothetical protein